MFVYLRARQRRVLILLITITLNVVCATAAQNDDGIISFINKQVHRCRRDEAAAEDAAEGEGTEATGDAAAGDAAADGGGGGGVPSNITLSGPGAEFLLPLNWWRDVAAAQEASKMNLLSWDEGLVATATSAAGTPGNGTSVDKEKGVIIWADGEIYAPTKDEADVHNQMLLAEAKKVGCTKSGNIIACAFDVPYKSGDPYVKGKSCDGCTCSDKNFVHLCVAGGGSGSPVPKASVVLLFAGCLASLFMA